MKEDPLVNRMELIKEAIKSGFSRKNVEQFISQGLTPEQLVQALDALTQMGVVDPQTAEAVAAQIMQQGQAQAPGQGVGRPPSADPTAIMEKSMEGTDNTQINAQNAAAYKQQGVAKGPQGV
jgi:hypothetical protein